MFAIEQIKLLNDLEREVYQAVLLQKEKVLTKTLKQFSMEIHISPATILRFCKKIGCNGFTEFKVRYQLFLDKKDTYQFSESISEILDYFYKIDKISFYEKITQIAQIILDSKFVVFIGVGSSGILAEYGARYITNMGKMCFSLTDPFYPILTKDLDQSIVIVLSESGETLETLNQVKNLKEADSFILAITNHADCTLSKFADLNLTYHLNSKRSLEFFDVTSQVPVIFILESIGKMVKKLSLEDNHGK
ncbi:MAG TPA: MurR/RpiR family transcriptional regulator [Enterococcus columbae]|nr:MurR/RpiR family transcriptional regulator [Enterococcus columbae]